MDSDRLGADDRIEPVKGLTGPWSDWGSSCGEDGAVPVAWDDSRERVDAAEDPFAATPANGTRNERRDLLGEMPDKPTLEAAIDRDSAFHDSDAFLRSGCGAEVPVTSMGGWSEESSGGGSAGPGRVSGV